MSPSRLPRARGPLGERLLHALRSSPDEAGVLRVSDVARHRRDAEDEALCLWVLHELHYRGFADVDDRWEGAPVLAWLRRELEDDLEHRLRARFAAVGVPAADDVADVLFELVDSHEGPSLARHVQRSASYEEVVDLLQQRSIYHLKEADPTSWVVPRLEARPKAALMQVQYDEYGVGDPDRLHHELFARGLAASGLDAAYGAYIDLAALPVLEQNNAVSMFGLQRRLRGAAVGHLAAVEATSSLPSRRLAQGLRRLGFPEEMALYYDEHVEADAVHEQVAVRDVCGALVADEPGLRDDVLMGAWTCLDLESRTASCLLERWTALAA